MRVITRRNLEAALAVIETRLACEAESLDLKADRARILTELGQTDEAKSQYLEILKRDPRHLVTLINFSNLLYQTGYTSAARTASTAAVTFHPGHPKAHTHFADLSVYDEKFDIAREHYEAALRIDPGHLDAHRGLAIVFWELGDEPRARHHQNIQFKDRPVEMLPYLGTGEPVPLLVLMSATGGNLPWRDLIDKRVFLIVTVAPEYYDLSKPLPAHRLIFNTIGDADICGHALEAATKLLKQTTAPVINSPSAVRTTGRMFNAERFGRIPGVLTPTMVRMPRDLLTGPDAATALAKHNLAFPLLLRRPGFHTGHHFVLVESPDALPAAAAGLPGDEVLVIQYLDAPVLTAKHANIESCRSEDDFILCIFASPSNGRCITSLRKCRETPSIRPKRPPSSTTCRASSARRGCGRSNKSARHSASTMEGSISVSGPRARSCSLRPMPRWSCVRPMPDRNGITAGQALAARLMPRAECFSSGGRAGGSAWLTKQRSIQTTGRSLAASSMRRPTSVSLIRGTCANDRCGSRLPRRSRNDSASDCRATVNRSAKSSRCFEEAVLPYGTGNTHPRFWGWVHGSGNVAGVLGEMLAAFMNCNAGGRDHIATYIERQVIDWSKEIFGFPATASGILTSGTSMATLIALTVARDTKADADVQKRGVAAAGTLVGYASAEAHRSIAKAFDLLGLGTESLRLVPVDGDDRMRVDRLAEMIEADRAAGCLPFLVAASAGTAATGAIDDIDRIAQLCRAENLWMHVDAAFGGLAVLTPEFRPQLAAIAEADSVAFDFHKWLHVPYDAGCVLVRDAAAHRSAFAARPEYLAGQTQGLAAGEPWFCDFGPEMSRGFRALKIWFTLKTYGINRFAELIARNCAQAGHLAALVASHAEFELLAKVSLNIVCFRFVAAGLPEAALDALNCRVVTELQMQGIAVTSTTRIAGKTAIRAAITNHRTTTHDLEVLVAESLRLGMAIAREMSRSSSERAGRRAA